MRKRTSIFLALIGLLFLVGCGGTTPASETQATPTPAAATITEFALPTPMSIPGEITAGPDGNLWFTEVAGIGQITPAGQVTEFSIPTPKSAPGGIIAGPNDTLWFTEQEGNKIGRLTPAR